MAGQDAAPYRGPVVINLEDIEEALVDLPPGGKRGLRQEKDGFEEVLAELARALPVHGAAAGIPGDAYARVVEATGTLQKIREARAVIDKLAAVLDSSEAKHEHDRENELSLIVDTIKSTAKRRNPSITAAFEKTLEYSSRIADKAAETRRRKAERMAQSANGNAAPASGPVQLRSDREWA
jgi:hypothetical protein